MLYYTFSTSLGTKLLNIMELEVVTIHGPPHQYESVPHSTQSATEAHTQEGPGLHLTFEYSFQEYPGTEDSSHHPRRSSIHDLGMAVGLSKGFALELDG